MSQLTFEIEGHEFNLEELEDIEAFQNIKKEIEAMKDIVLVDHFDENFIEEFIPEEELEKFKEENLPDEVVDNLLLDLDGDPERIKAILVYKDEPLSLINLREVEYLGGYNYEFGGQEIRVMTEDEADEAYEEDLEQRIEDWDNYIAGTQMESAITSRCVDEDWFDDTFREMRESYYYDIKNEPAESDEYISRLHQELVEEGILDEPDWPEEPEEPDYPEEPDPDDYDTEEEYQEAYDEWNEEVADLKEEYEEELEEYEQKKEEMEEEIENSLDDAIAEAVDEYMKTIPDPVQEYIDEFGSEAFASAVEQHGLIDTDCAISVLEDFISRGDSLNYYSGEEDEVTVTFQDEKYDFLIYPMD